jgi:hypothetical protein
MNKSMEDAELCPFYEGKTRGDIFFSGNYLELVKNND